MKDTIEKLKNDLEQCHREFVTDGDVYTDYEGTAKLLIEKGWHKQSEGEWGFDGMSFTCSECGEYAPIDKHRNTIKSHYCPNCGAKMKGGAE